MSNEKIAVFQGSFDPFTRGHESIVQRALNIFDRVVVLVVHNSLKQGYFDVDTRVRIIEDTFSGEPRVSVMASDGLTVNVAKQVGACCFVRGVRTVQDYEYEMSIAEVNLKFSGIETLLLYTLPEFSHISSTIVREWLKYGKDMTEYLPKGLSPHMLAQVLSKRQL